MRTPRSNVNRDLRQMMIDRNLTQTEVAEHLNCGYNTLCSWLRSSNCMGKREKIIKAIMELSEEK